MTLCYPYQLIPNLLVLALKHMEKKSLQWKAMCKKKQTNNSNNNNKKL